MVIKLEFECQNVVKQNFFNFVIIELFCYFVYLELYGKNDEKKLNSNNGRYFIYVVLIGFYGFYVCNEFIDLLFCNGIKN